MFLHASVAVAVSLHRLRFEGRSVPKPSSLWHWLRKARGLRRSTEVASTVPCFPCISNSGKLWSCHSVGPALRCNPSKMYDTAGLVPTCWHDAFGQSLPRYVPVNFATRSPAATLLPLLRAHMDYHAKMPNQKPRPLAAGHCSGAL